MEIKDELRKIPGVDVLMNHQAIRDLLKIHPRNLITHIIQVSLENVRTAILNGQPAPGEDELIKEISAKITAFARKSLRPVINATGVIVHTNLGRAPFGDLLLDEVHDILRSYNNLEFNLEEGERGSRYVHVTELMKFLTGAEDVLVVNNNAAAVMLILRAFAKNKEVIISRGELIEIGGAFRMPDIMAASDCKMVEVGTTNKTKISDFAQSVTKKTAIIMKAHRSNYVIKGFTTEPTLNELVELGKKTGVTVVYDMGSGLLRKAKVKFLQHEPDVKSTLATGVDLVTFSGDKLLGGPQAGIIAGKKHLIDKLKKEPMTRAVRVGKTVLAMLEAVCMIYLEEPTLLEKSPVFRMMNANPETLRQKSEALAGELTRKGVMNTVVKSQGQAGGGALPEKTIESFAVQLEIPGKSKAEKNEKAEKIHRLLLLQQLPVLGILRKGQLVFDVLTIPDQDMPVAAGIIADVYMEVVHG
ncbi:MAG: L-seryl-tRNA(Sec) selenium transferase [Bacteroidales bacterium]|nr:L-seryl-tRNA(Sec) selenium transferase [Bacteroidales bacterium]